MKHAALINSHTSTSVLTTDYSEFQPARGPIVIQDEGQSYTGTIGNDTFVGTDGEDFFDIHQGGNDTVIANGGSDFINVGARLNAADSIDGGTDTFGLDGDGSGDELDMGGSTYASGLVLGPNTIKNIEQIVFSPGFSLFLTMNDGNVAANKGLTVFMAVDPSNPTTAKSLHFDGSAETDGSFFLIAANGSGAIADDILIGGQYNDILRGNGGTDFLDGQGGIDRVQFNAAPNGITVDLRNTTAQDTGWGLLTLLNVENVTGSRFADVMWGTDLNNYFNTNGGNDVISGLGGDDFIWASRSNNSLAYPTDARFDGGDGTDLLSFRTSVFTDPLDVSIDLRIKSAQDTNEGVFRLKGIENLQGGIMNDTLDGNGLANTIYGAEGNDTVNGHGGNDVLFGDKYTSNTGSLGDVAPYSVDAATPGNDTLDGGSGDDSLDGGDGDDTLIGSSGNDSLVGGGGADTLAGGKGQDALDGGGGNDTFVLSRVSESTGAGFDTLIGFDSDEDFLDLTVAVSSVHAAINGGSLSDATFDLDLTNAIRKPELGINQAVLFTPDSGDEAGHMFLIVNANGHAGYQAGKDFVFELDHPSNIDTLSAANFI